MTVLILASELDATADRMVDALAGRVDVVRFDTAWFPQEASLEAHLVDGRWVGTLSTGYRSVALERLRSIWYRNPSAFVFADGMSATERHWSMGQAKLGLGGVLSALPVLWVNHPSRAADASYKPTQLVLAAQSGLTVAPTLITNSETAAAAFISNSGLCVSKSLGDPSIVEVGGRKGAFTRKVKLGDELSGVGLTAHQFQAWIPKACETRVTVIGNQMFAARIHAHSPASVVDWRADSSAVSYWPCAVPAHVRRSLLRYMAASRLTYGACDFIVREGDGEWVFLECNAGGQYGWIEDAIGAPITETLAQLLMRGATS